MSSILNALRSAPTPTRHFTSLQIVASSKSQSAAGFNPEHHPVILQQLVESLSPDSFVTSSSEASTNTTTAAVKDSLSGKTLTSQASHRQTGSQAQGGLYSTGSYYNRFIPLFQPNKSDPSRFSTSDIMGEMITDDGTHTQLPSSRYAAVLSQTPHTLSESALHIRSKKNNIHFSSSKNERATEDFELQERQVGEHKDTVHWTQRPEHKQTLLSHGRHNYGRPPQSSSLALNADNAVENFRVVPSHDSGAKTKVASGAGVQASSARHIIEQDPTRLQQIRSSVFEFLRGRFSAHEYTVPRLFVVLHDNDDSNLDNGAATTTPTPTSTATTHSQGPHYRLYFLCECNASFTLPLGSGLNHLHIAKHVGYRIDPARQDEFFKRYGTMVLALLYYLKYGHDPSADMSLSFAQQQGQGIHSQQQQQQQQSFDIDEADLEKVGKVSSLRRADLPDSISVDVDARFDRMIEFLEGFRTVHSESGRYTQTDRSPRRNNSNIRDDDNNNDDDDGGGGGGEECENENEHKEDTKLDGLVSLSDLHHLYSFLGIANINTRLQSGQLGNLYRISNIKGQVSWVCVYHFRWTFLERNIDDFERWVVARRGHFDKQSGSVSITLFSRAHTRTFCSWIVNKVAPSLVEAHIKLGWDFGKKDLWRLAVALANSTVTILSLDGCSYAEDSNYKIFHKKYDPILYLLTHGQLHSLQLSRFPSLFRRLSSRSIKAPSLRRLEFGHGMDVSSKGRRALSHLLSSCTSLQELVLPGFSITDQHVQAIVSGIRTISSLNTLDLSDTQLNDSAAIVLAQGLYSTHITQLDLSKNELLSDTSAARIIRAVGPRLTSLKMAQTGFGDQAAAALAKSMDGISFSNTLQDQLEFQNRFDFVAITGGHRSGIRFGMDSPLLAVPYRTTKLSPKSRRKTQSKGNLIYLDIEDNQCTQEGFKALAKVKSRLYFVYLNLSGSKDLDDNVCAQILDRVASPVMMTLRLACTGFGSLSAKSLARAILAEPPMASGLYKRMSGPCQLEELDLQACAIDSEGLSILRYALAKSQALSYMKDLDLGHCGHLQDQEVQQLLKAILIPNGTARPLASSETERHNRTKLGSHYLTVIPANIESRDSSSSGSSQTSSIDSGIEDRRHSLPRSNSDPIPQSGIHGGESMEAEHPLKAILVPASGFFTNLRQLDLKSTHIGDDCAWLLAQAIAQPNTMLMSLTILDPVNMTMQGICWIVDGMCENMTIQEFGIGKSNPGVNQTDLELFGSGLVAMMEINKVVRSLTTLGAPLGAVAKGLLLNQTLHSVYLIRSKGQLEDMQLMGQALSFTRSLLVYWMGGSDESLLGPLHQQMRYQRAVECHQSQDIANLAGPTMATTSSPSTLQQQSDLEQKHKETQHENMYRRFDLLHDQDDQLQREQQQQKQQHQERKYQHELYQQHRLQNRQHQQRHKHPHLQHQSTQQTLRTYGGFLPREIRSALKAAFIFQTRPSPSYEEEEDQIETSIHRANSMNGPRAMNNGNGGGAGGNLSLWMRNPIIEGIRRNHSLIKVTLDSTTPHSPGGNRASLEDSATPGLSRTSSRSNGPTHDLSLHELQQLQHQQQQQMHKKVNANRKTLKERGRVGWEELRLLGVDDDVIREVCEDL
ncbi:hypothetical protein BGX21_004728 [Mortierella sp. AD011]|nr:hypothetical protein BGX20_007065 [Mortierella sp. AD010]KAF9400232.1 hypothetical protein BGX21_004728 [Mortierella sp. AD011]